MKNRRLRFLLMIMIIESMMSGGFAATDEIFWSAMFASGAMFIFWMVTAE